MSRISDVSNTLMDTTTTNHTNPKINEKTVRPCQPGNETILTHVAAHRLCCNRVHVACCNLLSRLELPKILQKTASLAYQWSCYGPGAGSRIYIATQVWGKRVSFWLNRSINTGRSIHKTDSCTSSECEIKQYQAHISVQCRGSWRWPSGFSWRNPARSTLIRNSDCMLPLVWRRLRLVGMVSTTEWIAPTKLI